MDDSNAPEPAEPVVTNGEEVSEIGVDSVTLARLVAEVRNGESFEPGSYNRQHNRHNR